MTSMAEIATRPPGTRTAGTRTAGARAAGGRMGATRPAPQAAFRLEPERLQTTLCRPIELAGVGLHGGLPVRLVLRPAPAGHGVVFCRTDLGGRRIAARHDLVADTRLCTLLADPADPALRVGTIEHLMAALAAEAVDNVLVELDGPEIPILDGSSLPYLDAIAQAGIARLHALAAPLLVRRKVRVEEGEGFAELVPAPHFGLSVTIDFAAAAIGRQGFEIARLAPRRFREELADARTFAMAAEIEALRAAGLARGGSLENAVVVDGSAVLNPGGLRRPDEFVRHKMLDAVGDLALAGRPIVGFYRAHRPGHRLNNLLLRALFADRANWHLALPESARSAA